MSLFDQLKNLHDKGLYSSVSTLSSIMLTMSESSSDILPVQPKYQTLVYYGDALFHSENYQKAEDMYKKALLLNKNDVRPEEEEPFEEVETTPEADVKFKAHLCLVETKQLIKAISLLESIAREDRTARVNMALAKLYQQNNIKVAAIHHYKKVLKECPLSTEVAQNLLLLGVNAAEVSSIMMAASAGIPNEWLSVWINAHCHLKAQELPHCIDAFKRIDEEPELEDNADNLVMLGEAYYYNGDYANAMDVLERAHILDPLLLKGMDVLAALLAKQKKVKELKCLTSELLFLSESTPEPWISVAYYHYATEQYTEAFSLVRKACMFDPTHIEALLLKALVLLELKKTGEAFTLFSEIHKVAPYRFEAHKGLVDCHLALHSRGDAIAVAKSAKKKMGNTAPVLTLLASLLIDDPTKVKKAKKLVKKALKQNPTYLDAVYLLATIYGQKRMFAKGIELLSKQLEQQETCELHQMLGDFFAQNNEREKALHHYNIALEMDPSSDRAIEGVQNIENPASPEDFNIDFQSIEDFDYY